MPSRLFDRIAEQYDAWYDAPEGRARYRAELETLRPLMRTSLAPALEVGVGTGRFAGEVRDGDAEDAGFLVLSAVG